MVDPHGTSDTTTRESSADAVLRSALMAGAADLARKGRYGAAENLLSDWTRGGRAKPPVLDLLARIHSQQGHLRLAEEDWQRAASLDPNNDMYRKALRRLARLQRKKVRWLPLRLSRLLLVVAASVVGIALLVHAVTMRLDALETNLAELNASGESVLSALAEMRRQPPVQDTTLPQPDTSLGVRLDVAAVSQRQDGAALVLTFDDGLFSQGDRLTTEAKETLTAVGRRLEPQAARIDVQVIGHSDDRTIRVGSTFADNAALGLHRALAVVEHMRETTALPPEVFSARTAGSSSPPFSNDGSANRARNRTVVIRLARASPHGVP